MINEREEFLAYTEQPIYSAQNKRDTTYMGRFTFDMLLDFEGLSRVLTIVARGYMWQGEEPDIERAARALRAWCSVPDSKKASPKGGLGTHRISRFSRRSNEHTRGAESTASFYSAHPLQYQTQFSDLHGEFPELEDEQGSHDQQEVLVPAQVLKNVDMLRPRVEAVEGNGHHEGCPEH